MHGWMDAQVHVDLNKIGFCSEQSLIFSQFVGKMNRGEKAGKNDKMFVFLSFGK